jgi:hypothetical protein
MGRATVVLALLCVSVGCSAKQHAPQHAAPPAEPTLVPTPFVVPTVPPGTPAPPTGAALPTRPVKNPNAEAEKRSGKQVGPVITFFGIARADGQLIQPVGKNPEGYPIYRNPVGSGFIIVVEAKPGISNVEPGRSIFRYDPNDPKQRPDLEIEVNRPLGDGSTEVCDSRRPKIGGVPAINPPSFADTKQVSATLNDLSCRFETFLESSASCTVGKSGDFSFADPKNSKAQFCMVVAKAWNFPEGETLVSARVRDSEGNPGPVDHFVLERKPNPTPVPASLPKPTPTAPRRRP